MNYDEETQYYLDRDPGVNARNILDQAYEACTDEAARLTLFHAILYLNGSVWTPSVE